MKKISINGLVAALLLISMYSCNQEQKVYEWRGENRSGIYADEGLLKSWPETGPEVVWEYEGIGNGYGSPVFTPDGMYIMGEVDSLAWLFSFDLEGKLKWKKDFGKEWVENWNGSRCAPTIVDDLVYVMSGMGNLYCFDRITGDKIWSVDMINDLQGEFPLFGISEAVIIEDEKVFCTPGGKDNNVLALDRFTGEIIWTSKGAGERPGYNQPQIIELEDRNVLVNFTAYEMMGHDTKTGELLFVNKQDNTPIEEREPGKGDTHANSIVYDDGYIYYAAGDGNGGVKLRLEPDGSSVEEVWRNKKFDSYMGGIVKLGDYLYGCGSVKPGFMSINATTGEIGSVLKIASGAVIAADSMLYYYNYRGEVMLITQDPLNMEVVSKFRMKKGAKEHFAHPVINDGKLYVRHGDFIQAFDIKE
ncbi:MAG: PQQ-binding-like beta-propeller repeat protein [Bacteroidota bacterium]|nr:PQQ-binding-like beta-propeller repeat protein [Bacteroidota bacterium]